MQDEFLTFSELRLWLPVLETGQLRRDRLRAKQIMMNLEGKAWNRPEESRRWQGFEGALALLGTLLCIECKRRGVRDGLISYFALRAPKHENFPIPDWML